MISFIICHIVPFDSPNILQATSISRSAIHLIWSPPLVPYGNIVSYAINVERRTEENSTNMTINSTNETNHTIENLLTFTWYNISIAAATKIGTGPYSAAVFIQTLQDSKYNLISILIFDYLLQV